MIDDDFDAMICGARIMSGLNAGATVRVLRKSANLTCDDLARISGVSTKTIYLWERNIRTPSVSNISAILESLERVLVAQLRP